MNTLFLRPDTWDLTLDVNGNIAVAHSLYQQAQDIASACRVFIGDLYFNQKEGIPYLQEILGKHHYPLALYRKYLIDAALSVKGVKSAVVDFSVNEGRVVSGSITFTNEHNEIGTVSL